MRPLLVATALSFACSSPQGAVGQSCYGNGTCNTGLTCASNLCVDLRRDGSVDGGGLDAAQDSATQPDLIPPAFKRVFVTSTGYSGNFGSLAAVDNACQTVASKASLGGTWLAWVSTSTSDAATRFNHSTLPYQLLDGTVVAADWNGLVSGTLTNAINLDEKRANANAFAWTGTTPSGVAMANLSCNDWAAGANNNGLFGWSTSTNSFWTQGGQQSCLQLTRLYCFEQ